MKGARIDFISTPPPLLREKAEFIVISTLIGAAGTLQGAGLPLLKAETTLTAATPEVDEQDCLCRKMQFTIKK
jgi:hypothetical protein